jgi:hypothetical protein
MSEQVTDGTDPHTGSEEGETTGLAEQPTSEFAQESLEEPSGFTRYDARSGLRRTVPRVSIRAGDTIGINSAALEKYFDEIEYAALFFDNDKDILGIRPMETNRQGVYSLHRTEQSAYLNAKAFIEEFGLSVSESESYGCEWDSEAGILTVDLSNPLSN